MKPVDIVVGTSYPLDFGFPVEISHGWLVPVTQRCSKTMYLLHASNGRDSEVADCLARVGGCNLDC